MRLADQIQLGAGQRDDVERVHHRHRIRDHIGCGGLVAGEPIHRDHLDAGSECCGLRREPAGQRGR
jgi:hypothetical protein